MRKGWKTIRKTSCWGRVSSLDASRHLLIAFSSEKLAFGHLLSLINLLVGLLSCLWMVLVPSVATFVILESGLRPPCLRMNITVGVLSFLWMLLLSSGDDLVILEGGLRPPSFLMRLLAGVLSCPWMLLLLSVDTIAIIQGGLRPPSFL